ncbi:MAG: 30S ribosomal protein S27e [Candidatus Bathyarchaeota archaeon]|nr:30S ribosomal protein S27e [Candidatus Bathyarchaeota archaeon]
MVSRLKELIPRPRSRFLRVKCSECGNEQVIFNMASMRIPCSVCGGILAEPSGGKAVIKGEVIEELT